MKLPGWVIVAMIAAGVISIAIANFTATPPPPTPEQLKQQLEDLLRQRDQSQGNVPSELDAKIFKLEKQLEGAQSDQHLMEYMRAKEKERDDLKHKAEQDQADLEKIREEEVSFRKHCESLKEKKISDLTVQDAEDLKNCGITLPRLPVP